MSGTMFRAVATTRLGAELKADSRRHHLLIAGTGRAGTSFLVRYLAEAGLETHLQARGEQAVWYDEVNAGLEDLPISGVSGPMPYVIKSPATAEVIDDVLTDPEIVLDTVIVPVRDLTEAASSRVITELAALHRTTPWMTRLSKTWSVQGHTPAGVLYSLDPLDQARILAVGFHRLIERLVATGTPIVFLSFPRFVLDENYLWTQLKPLLEPAVDRERARRAYAAIADRRKVRTGDELAVAAGHTPAEENGDRLASLDRIALARELDRVRGELARLAQALSAANARADGAETAYNAIQASRFWRSTAIPRRIVRWFGRNRHTRRAGPMASPPGGYRSTVEPGSRHERRPDGRGGSATSDGSAADAAAGSARFRRRPD